MLRRSNFVRILLYAALCLVKFSTCNNAFEGTRAQCYDEKGRAQVIECFEEKKKKQRATQVDTRQLFNRAILFSDAYRSSKMPPSV